MATVCVYACWEEQVVVSVSVDDLLQMGWLLVFTHSSLNTTAINKVDLFRQISDNSMFTTNRCNRTACHVLISQYRQQLHQHWDLWLKSTSSVGTYLVHSATSWIALFYCEREVKAIINCLLLLFGVHHVMQQVFGKVPLFSPTRGHSHSSKGKCSVAALIHLSVCPVSSKSLSGVVFLSTWIIYPSSLFRSNIWIDINLSIN